MDGRFFFSFFFTFVQFVQFVDCSSWWAEMKLTFLGTCSGTEPIGGYRHVSFTVETDGGVYFFDAGESCGYTAHVMGIDMLSVRAVFISHTHMDHIGGLPLLLGTMWKLIGMTGPDHPMAGKALEVLIPDRGPWEGVLKMCGASESDPNLPFALNAHTYADGPVFDDGAVAVSALHNEHLGKPVPPNPWRSFSFRIEAEGKAIVYSGDVKHVSELAGLAEGGCDLLLMETGHHVIPEVCEYLRDAAWPIGRIAFIHHGRATLADPAGEARRGSDILGREVLVLQDRETMAL